ncbi:MAG TPA: hypothetical protein DCL15_10435 [Chloroflexi bacterium]|nr:hypothetical protein [Chloroflexota bacterium]HHW84706.1 hypothetical protein [Chloroflexota bacterium]
MKARFTRFDLTVLGALAMTLAALAALIWRGDQVGLSVVATTPAADAANVSTRSHLRIVFDQLLDSTASAALVLSPPTAGEMHIEGDVLTFVPTALLPDTLYTARLEPGLRGANGRTLHTPLVWRFATGHAQALFTRVVAGKEQLFAAPLPGQIAAADLPPATQLTDLGAGLWEFAVSPVDSRIVLAALTEQGTSDLWLMTPGSAPELLLACPSTFCSSPSWSHDGELLLFSQRNASGFGAAAVSPPRLYIMHIASGETAPVFADSQRLGFEARWSSDNQWITYLSPDFVGVGVYNLETGVERFYPTQTGEAAVWQPGATRFVMNEQRMIGERNAIHLILVDPIADTRLDLSGETAAVEDGAAVWSPDGQWIAFRRNITDGPDATLTKQLWLMRSDGSQAHPLTNDPAIDHGPPVWSPDGKTLLFHKFPLKGPEIVISVWMLDVASGEQRQVATPGQRPQWLP